MPRGAGFAVGMLVASALLVMIVAGPVSSGTHSGGGSSASAALGERAPSASADSIVTFAEKGLPVGTDWEVQSAAVGLLFATDNTTTTTELNETLPDGSYNVSADADRSDYATYGPATSLTLTGSNVTETVHFYLGYHVVLAPTGLPYNVSWNVSLSADGYTQNESLPGDASADFWIPAGAYSYTDASVGYAPSTSLGSGTLGSNASIDLTFAREKILPGKLTISLNAASADVYLNGVVYPGVKAGLTSFNLTPGVWTVFALASGYVSYYNVTKIVSNQTVVMDVTLHANPVNPGPPLLSATADVIVLALACGLGIILVLFVIAWSRLSNR